MKHYQWSELDYIAGAAHAEGMSYGRYVSCGMPNLERFKRRADAGEFDNKPVRARSRRGTLAAVAAQDKPEGKPEDKPEDKPESKPKRKRPGTALQTVRQIGPGKCQDCGAELAAEFRPGPARKFCKECDARRRQERKTRYMRSYRENKQKRPTDTVEG